MQATPRFRTRLAATPQDLRAAQRLRYRVFVQELGAGGPLVDHDAGLEIDARDHHATHLLLEDISRPDTPVVGVYRLMRADQAQAAGGFATAREFDLAPLIATGRPLLELGRSCLLPAYRGGPAMGQLFAALAGLLADAPDTILFGVASFPGTDAATLSEPLAHLRQHHLAPEQTRPWAIGPGARAMPRDGVADRKAALRATPALIKAYLRMGGVVGEGACVDADFNTTDVCMILDAAAMSPDQRRRLAVGGPA